MSDDRTCPGVAGLDDETRLALALLFQQVGDAAPSITLWASSVEDVVLGYGCDEPGLPLCALGTAELCAVHSLLVVASGACDEKPYRSWLVELGRMITDELTAREAEEMLTDAKFAAYTAEEQRRDRENNPPPDLRGLPPWNQP